MSMMPGRRIRVNENSAWPERVGHEGAIVDPSIFGGVYPGYKLPSGAVIVKLDADPLKDKTDSLGQRDDRWTCVMTTLDVTSIDV